MNYNYIRPRTAISHRIYNVQTHVRVCVCSFECRLMNGIITLSQTTCIKKPSGSHGVIVALILRERACSNGKWYIGSRGRCENE